MKFTKPAIDVDAQIALLKQRGLVVADDNVAPHYLPFVGYYRLPENPPMGEFKSQWFSLQASLESREFANLRI